MVEFRFEVPVTRRNPCRSIKPHDFTVLVKRGMVRTLRSSVSEGYNGRRGDPAEVVQQVDLHGTPLYLKDYKMKNPTENHEVTTSKLHLLCLKPLKIKSHSHKTTTLSVYPPCWEILPNNRSHFTPLRCTRSLPVVGGGFDALRSSVHHGRRLTSTFMVTPVGTRRQVPVPTPLISSVSYNLP